MKKVLLIILSISVLFSTLSCLSITSYADEIEVLSDSGKCGKNAYYTFDEETGLLTISGTGAIDGFSFYSKDNIKKVIVKPGITIISDFVFEACENLREITLPDGITHIGCEVLSRTPIYKNKNNKYWKNHALYCNNYLIQLDSNYFDNMKFKKNQIYKIAEGTKLIARRVFSDSVKIAKLYIPKSVKYIESAQFNPDLAKITDVYYAGSKADAKKITFNDYAGKTEKNVKLSDIFPSQTVIHYNATLYKRPKPTEINSLKSFNKSISVKWKGISGVDGYEIQYGLKKSFKKSKKKTVKGAKKTKLTIKKLKSKKKYFVRIRTYKVVNGKKVYSKWSKVKNVKVK